MQRAGAASSNGHYDRRVTARVEVRSLTSPLPPLEIIIQLFTQYIYIYVSPLSLHDNLISNVNLSEIIFKNFFTNAAGFIRRRAGARPWRMDDRTTTRPEEVGPEWSEGGTSGRYGSGYGSEELCILGAGRMVVWECTGIHGMIAVMKTNKVKNILVSRWISRTWFWRWKGRWGWAGAYRENNKIGTDRKGRYFLTHSHYQSIRCKNCPLCHLILLSFIFFYSMTCCIVNTVMTSIIWSPILLAVLFSYES